MTCLKCREQEPILKEIGCYVCGNGMPDGMPCMRAQAKRQRTMNCRGYVGLSDHKKQLIAGLWNGGATLTRILSVAVVPRFVLMRLVDSGFLKPRTVVKKHPTYA